MIKRSSIALLALAAVCAGGAGARPFELYQPIIDRYPFGPPPDDATVPPESAKKGGAAGAEGEAGAELTPDQAELQQSVTVSVINIGAGGTTMVGFTDAGASPQKHYYMEAGEERDGWTVKSIDPVAESVVLVKDTVEITRKLGEKATAKGGKKGAARAAGPAFQGQGRSPLIAGRWRGGGTQGVESMKSRRQQKHEQEEADRKARLEQAEATKRMQEEAARQRQEAEAEREAEREERKQMLLDIQEQLRKAREENQRRREEEAAQEGQIDADNDA